MRLALDTNRYTDFVQGHADTVRWIRAADAILVPLIVLGELRGGFLCGTRARENEARLIEFLQSPRVSLLVPDEQTTHHYAQLFQQLRRQGTPMPVNDLWIAALVIQHSLHLLTRDRHFDHLPQIPRL